LIAMEWDRLAVTGMETDKYCQLLTWLGDDKGGVIGF